LRKKLIYIDQFALSNILKVLNKRIKGHERALQEEFWIKLFEALDSVVRLQLVVCPQSSEHTRESLLSPFNDEVRRLMDHFSCGIHFPDTETIRRFQVHRAAEGYIRGVPVKPVELPSLLRTDHNRWQEVFIFSVNSNLAEFVDPIREERDELSERLKAVFQRWQSERKTFDEYFLEEGRAFGPMVWELYLDWVRSNYVHVVLATVPPFSAITVTNIERVFSENGVSTEQMLAAIKDFLYSDILLELPFNRISASLYAVLARKANAGQKKPPNRGTPTDISMTSTLLPYCDAMFIDNKCRALVNDIPKDRALPFQTRLFSLDNAADFLAYLKDIENSASKEHIRIIDEIYGPDWKRPYTTMFDASDQ
jgi:hypothetical protein